MCSAMTHDHGLDTMLRVTAAAELEYLVKESEVVTGKPGRNFVISGADRLVYRVQWHPFGCNVQRLDEAGEAMSTHFVLHPHLQAHSLGEALRAGQLYTPAVLH